MARIGELVAINALLMRTLERVMNHKITQFQGQTGWWSGRTIGGRKAIPARRPPQCSSHCLVENDGCTEMTTYPKDAGIANDLYLWRAASSVCPVNDMLSRL